MEVRRVQLEDLPAIETFLRKHQRLRPTDGQQQVLDLFYRNELCLIFCSRPVQEQQNLKMNDGGSVEHSNPRSPKSTGGIFGFMSLSHKAETWLELEMFACEDLVQIGFLFQAFSSCFLCMPRIQTVRCFHQSILPKVKVPPMNQPLFNSVSGGEYYVLDRKQLVPQVEIRRARMEDCDDLLPLFKQHAMLPPDADDYYVAMLIEAPLPNHQLVCQLPNGGKVIGFMSISPLPVENKLQQVFDLEPYSLGEKVEETREERNRQLNKRFASLSSQMALNTSGAALRNSQQHLAPDTAKALKITQAVSGAHIANTQSLQQLNMSEPAVNDSDETAAENEDGSFPVEAAAILQKSTLAINADGSASNAFCISLFCMDERYVALSHTFMSHAFSLFDDREYCLLTLASTSVEPPLLKLFHQVPVKSEYFSTECLYICHRAELKVAPEVRLAVPDDKDSIYSLIQGLPNEQQVVQFLCKSPKNAEAPVITVVEAAGNLVGLLIFVNQSTVDMEEQYDFQTHLGNSLQNHQKSFDGVNTLHTILLNPIFTSHTRSILRQCQRLLDITFLLTLTHQQPQTTTHGTQLPCHTYGVSGSDYPIDVMTQFYTNKEFYQLRPRRRIVYPNNTRDDRVIAGEYCGQIRILPRYRIDEDRLTINARIVIVGGGTTGTGVIEGLLGTSYLHFPNLILVDDSSVLSCQSSCHYQRKLAGQLFGHEGNLRRSSSFMVDDSEEYTLHQLSIEQMNRKLWMGDGSYWHHELCRTGFMENIILVRARMTGINRKNRRLNLDNGSEFPYDYLVLTPGLQHDAAMISEEFSAVEGVINIHRRNAETIYRLLLRINRQQKLTVVPQDENLVVVYGGGIQALAMINYLQSFSGINPNRVLWCIPPERASVFISQDHPLNSTSTAPSCFESDQVDQICRDIFAKHVMVGKMFGTLKSWQVDNDGYIKSITVQNAGTRTEVEVKCKLILYAAKKAVPEDTFLAINNANLVFDQRLVIDHLGRTHDQHIFSCGPCTRYSVRYQTKWCHAYHNSKEVGQKEADVLLQLFDPLSDLSSIDSSHSNASSQLFQFTKAVKFTAHLPGNYFFLKFDRPHLPGEYTDALKKRSKKILTQIVSTTNEDQETGLQTHCRFDLDSHGYIVSMTYIGQPTIFTDNFMSLDGIHEKYLNNLVWRWQKDMIPNLAQYLCSSWVIPVYCDGFLDLVSGWRKQVLEYALGSGDDAVSNSALKNADPEFKQEIRKILEKLSNLSTKSSDSEKRAPYETFDGIKNRKLLDTEVDQFLNLIIPGYDMEAIATNQQNSSNPPTKAAI